MPHHGYGSANYGVFRMHGMGHEFWRIMRLAMAIRYAKQRARRREALRSARRDRRAGRVYTRGYARTRASPQVIITPVVMPAMTVPTRRYVPPPPRELHAGYWAARGGPPLDVREPVRGRLEIVERPTTYTPPLGVTAAAPVASERSPSASATPQAAPTPAAPVGYRGSLRELVAALTSSGYSEAQARRKVRNADLCATDDEAQAIIKCLHAQEY